MKEITDPDRIARLAQVAGAQTGVQDTGQNMLSSILQSPGGRFAEGVAAPAMEMTAGVPSFQDFPGREQMLERARRPAGLAKTLGRVAGETAVSMVPGAPAYRSAQLATKAAPFVRHIAPLAAESAAVGALEGVKAPREGETRLGQAAETAAFNFGIGTGMATAGRLVAPRMFPKSERARLEEASMKEVGVEPRLPLSIAAEPTGPVGKSLQWLHRQPLRAVPGPGSMLKKQTDEYLDDVRESMLLRALPKRGRADVLMPRARPDAEAPIQDTFRDIDKWYKGQYTDILGDQQFTVTTGPGAERVTAAYADLPGEAQNEVAQYIADLIARKISDFGGLTGDAISDIKKTLRRRAGSPMVDSDVQQGLRNTIEALDDVVEDTLRVNNPKDAIRYAELRPAYRNLVTLEKAASRGEGKAYGEFSPNDVLEAGVSKIKKERGERAVAQGRGPLQLAAQRSKYLMEPIPKKQTANNVFQVGALASLAGLGGWAAPVTTSGILGGVAMSLPRWGQKRLMSEYPHQKALLSALRKRPVQETLRGGRLATTGYMMED